MTPTAGISPVDEAFGLAADGKEVPALHILTSLFERIHEDNTFAIETGIDSPREPHDAALLLAELLANAHPETAKKAALKLRDAFVATGDLPQAVVACHVAAGANTGRGPGGSALAGVVLPVAQAYAQGSKRLADVPRKPPALPIDNFALAPRIKALKGSDLYSEAKLALERYLKAASTPDSSASLPRLPLFSALSSRSLGRLLPLLAPGDLPKDGLLIRRGEEGKQLFVVVRGMLEAFREGPDGEARLALLGPGAIVGEMALVSDAPRAASVRALEPTRVLVASKEALEKEAGREAAIGEELASFCRARMLTNLLHHSFALGALKKEERTALLDHFQTQTCEAGTVLVSEGEPGPGLFLIAAGHVRVSHKDEDGDTLVVAELGPGEVVGEISLVLRRPATATVTTTHKSILLFLPAEAFQKVVSAHPGLLQQLYPLAIERDDELQSVVAQQAVDAEDVTLL